VKSLLLKSNPGDAPFSGVVSAFDPLKAAAAVPYIFVPVLVVGEPTRLIVFGV
jgi:hypothetical protein